MAQAATQQQQISAILPGGSASGPAPDPAPQDQSAETIRILLQQTAPQPPQPVQDYLGMLGLLYGVPFENLVADSRMLPRESIRFFYVDANWIESIVDGALSTGVHSDRDIRFSRVLRDTVRLVTEQAIGEVRPKLRGKEPGETLGGTLTGSIAGPYNITTGQNDDFSIRIDNGHPVTVKLTQGAARTAEQIAAELNGNSGFSAIARAVVSGGSLSISATKAGAALRLGGGNANPTLGFTVVRAGFLLRSAVVSGWPGLEVQGFRDSPSSPQEPQQKIQLLRMDRLSPDVLLVIFESVPAVVVINEPRETLHFGTKSVLVATRNPLNVASRTTNPIDSIPMRTSDPTVIDVETLQTKVKGAISSPTALNSADLAIQMVESAIKVNFTVPRT